MNSLNKTLVEVVLRHMQPAMDKGICKGYAVSVELDGEPLLKLYSGNADDIEIDDVYHPVNANTQFDVASVAKQFVACCIAILACENRLNLDDSVRIYLPEMKDYADKITIRHCLSMTSGVRNFQLTKYFMSNSSLNEMEIFFRQEQPENEPGNFNSYSECCYEMLGHIVERLTGGNALFAKQRIFEPLGMADTKGDEGDYIMGGGGLYSTSDDLVKWHNCLLNRNLPGAPDGLFDIFFSSFTLNNGELCPYGFGFFYDENNRNVIWQYGNVRGSQSVIRADLEKRLSIIVLTCSDYDPVKMALDLENIILNDMFGLPDRGNYKSAYFNRPIQTAESRQVKHHNFPNTQKQNPITDSDMVKYLGRYYGYEIDTYFDIVPDGSRIQMKYTDKDGNDYTNLLDFADATQLMTRTCGDWGTFRFPIEFYGNEHKIDFFVLQRGSGVLFGYGDEVTRAGYFYFVKCTA